MIAPTELRLVLVTPETTLVDEPVLSLRFPLFDGQMGVLPGRAPVVGRLGVGELRMRTAGGERSFFIDGGFLQIKGSVVSILTHRAIPAEKVDAALAQADLDSTQSMVPTTDAAYHEKLLAQERARKRIAIGRRSR